MKILMDHKTWMQYCFLVVILSYPVSVILFTFWGLVPVWVELGKITAFFHKMGKNCKSQLVNITETSLC